MDFKHQMEFVALQIVEDIIYPILLFALNVLKDLSIIHKITYANSINAPLYLKTIDQYA